MKKLLVILCYFIALANYSFAEQLTVEAYVNNEAITDLDVNKRMDLYVKSLGVKLDSKTTKLIRQRIVYSLVDEKLIAHEAKAKNIEVDEQDMLLAMNSIAEKNQVKPEDLEKFLQGRGISKAVLEDQIRAQILLNKYMRVVLEPRISISEIEIKESRRMLERNLHGSRYKIVQAKLQEIVLYPKYKKRKSEQELAHKLVSEINSGADFSELAKDFSDSMSASSGGNIGWIYLDQMIPELAKAISRLEVGHVSAPIYMVDGSVRIMKLLDAKKKEDNSIPDKINDAAISEYLQNRKLDLQVKALLVKLRREGYVRLKH